MTGIKKVLVVGAGIMGNGITQVLAEAGFTTYIRDLTEELLQKGMAKIEHNLAKKVSKGKMSAQQQQEIISRIIPVTELQAATETDLIIEAATEKFVIKEKIFQELDQLAPKDTILASNTSSISITKLAAATSRPGQVVGTHFFNPVPVMPIVEIIRGLETSEATVEMVKDVIRETNKEIVAAKDYPAFLLNRILLPLLNEAFYCYMEGQASREDIDKGMKLAMGHPMGPLELADFVGLDTLLSVFEVMYEGYGDPKYFPCPILVKMVEAGHFGVKSGRGFYDYALE